ncbi:MFS transporter [Colwellia psychrerythraea]|uniref:Major facilitator superfamily transporter n=1 Tax=Colwellia psychrerythraea (strain 34H / ATCC BAA-681) TaxID=167879 RepID=Q47ZV0_COLP3|nr:MFS transporter [Colwellia psychrerythraea]AAZ25016.1 major facilitator superfamily transporter [Colwellia psychrerythraea 34H]
MSNRPPQQLNILVSMYLGYAAMMICRQMVTILSPALLADESLGLTKTNLGDFAAYGTIGALVGKLIWGPLADKIGGRFTFLIGIFLTAVFVIAFGLSPNVMAFTGFSFLLYCTKSSGWPGLAKLVGEWYHPQHYGRAWSILSTSSRLSVVLATLFFGWLLSFMHWRTVAFIASVFSLVILVGCYFYLKEKPDNPNFFKENETNADNFELTIASKQAMNNKYNHPLQGTGTIDGLVAFAKSPRVLLVVIMLMVLTCMMAFLDFVAVYLMESYRLTPSQAAMASTVFPVGSLTGLLASIAFYDRFSKRGIRTVLTLSLILSLLSVLTLQYLPLFNLSAEINYLVALGAIFLFAFSISPAYYLPMSIFSIEFGGPHSATLVCLIDAFGFAASATFAFIGGRLADSSGGWSSFMNMLILISAVGIISVWAFMHSEYKAAKRLDI